MKESKKDMKPKSEVRNGMTFTVDESLAKYLSPEYDSPKLKDIKEKFSKGITIHK